MVYLILNLGLDLFAQFYFKSMLSQNDQQQNFNRRSGGDTFNFPHNAKIADILCVVAADKARRLRIS